MERDQLPVEPAIDVVRHVSVWPGMDTLVDSVISVPARPQPAEACCGDFEESSCGVGDVEAEAAKLIGGKDD